MSEVDPVTISNMLRLKIDMVGKERAGLIASREQELIESKAEHEANSERWHAND